MKEKITKELETNVAELIILVMFVSTLIWSL